MRKASEITQLPVLSISEGLEVEKMSLFAVNPTTRKVEFVAFAGTPWYESPWTLPWTRIKAVGRDLITIKSKKDLSQITEDLRRQFSRTVSLIGLEVIDASGRLSGRVADFTLDESTGELHSLLLSNGAELDVASIVTISASMVITEGAAVQKDAAPEAPSENDFLLGKTVAADITDEAGKVLIAAGTVISAREIDAAKAAGALYELVTGVK